MSEIEEFKNRLEIATSACEATLNEARKMSEKHNLGPVETVEEMDLVIARLNGLLNEAIGYRSRLATRTATVRDLTDHLEFLEQGE